LSYLQGPTGEGRPERRESLRAQGGTDVEFAVTTRRAVATRQGKAGDNIQSSGMGKCGPADQVDRPASRPGHSSHHHQPSRASQVYRGLRVQCSPLLLCRTDQVYGIPIRQLQIFTSPRGARARIRHLLLGSNVRTSSAAVEPTAQSQTSDLSFFTLSLVTPLETR
jgi:hypothetical protein